MGDFWQQTAELYSQLIQKPKMTQKLLEKPPFRYLHDIFTATMAETGFAQGLYTEAELDAKSITERDQKISFLAKMIALVELMIGEKIDVKPAKIVAGLEPEKTNSFLVVLFQAATSGVDSKPFVNQVMGVDDGGEEGGDQQEAMRRQQEQEEQEKLRQIEEKKKKADQKKQQEAQKKKQQEEEEDRQRQEQEMLRQRAMEEQKAKKKAQKKEKQQAAHIIREGDEQEEQHEQQEEPEQIERPRHDFDPNQKHGAVVEEAIKLMKEGEDEQQQRQEDGGPKIRLGKIGQRKKPQQDQAQAYTKQGVQDRGQVQEKKVTSGIGGGFSESDIEFMKKAIQILCQSTNPLGKSIDFVTDDIDSMSKEFEYWKRESLACQSKLEEQQRITEEVIQPLQDQQAELEERIREQQSKINSIKSQIMRNDITIQNLLYSVISTR